MHRIRKKSFKWEHSFSHEKRIKTQASESTTDRHKVNNINVRPDINRVKINEKKTLFDCM